jgi:hypothetical protein
MTTTFDEQLAKPITDDQVDDAVDVAVDGHLDGDLRREPRDDAQGILHLMDEGMSAPEAFMYLVQMVRDRGDKSTTGEWSQVALRLGPELVSDVLKVIALLS